jgi:hypothetical protein
MRADFDDDVALVRGAGFKAGPAGALDVDAFILRVNTLFWHAIILFLIFMPAGVRIACNGSGHVTSKCLSRRRLRPGKGALKQCL